MTPAGSQHLPMGQPLCRQLLMQSFFGSMQVELLDRRTWATQTELRTAIVTWIERIYRRLRRRRIARPIDRHRARTIHDHTGN